MWHVMENWGIWIRNCSIPMDYFCIFPEHFKLFPSEMLINVTLTVYSIIISTFHFSASPTSLQWDFHFHSFILPSSKCLLFSYGRGFHDIPHPLFFFYFGRDSFLVCCAGSFYTKLRRCSCTKYFVLLHFWCDYIVWLIWSNVATNIKCAL